MTRLWPVGLPINMTDANGDSDAGHTRPTSFVWQGQTHRVVKITREWRVDIDWWRGRVWRAYFKLSTHSGLLVIIYQDLLSGEWYLQRLYD
ncbi:MAG: hypothetical protein PVH18_02650 [Chloroflexota bacterium]|jgi:hypothetical protein